MLRAVWRMEMIVPRLVVGVTREIGVVHALRYGGSVQWYRHWYWVLVQWYL